LQLAGLQSRSDTLREPRLGVATATDSSGVRLTDISPGGAAAAAGLRAGDRIVSIGDVAIANDDSFAIFRTRYAGTQLTSLPIVIRRGGETTTLELPVPLFTRVQTRVSPIPGASEKAARIHAGILTGSTS